MLRQHLKNHSKKPSNFVLNNAVQQFKNDSERRREDLIAFLNEFVNSEEYEQYMARKRNLKKRNASTQFCPEDLKMGESEIVDKYPLTTQSRKMIAFKQYLDKYTRNKNNKEVVENQERGIKIVKEKMDEYKNLYESTKDKMYQMRERRENKVLEEFCDTLNIDISTLSLRTKNTMRDKVVCYQKIKNSRNLRVKKNIMDIVKKLIDEYKRKKQIDKTLNKTYLYKVSKREKILKNMEIVGHKIILKPREDSKKEEEQEKVEEEEQPPPIEIEEPIKKKRKGKKEKTGKNKGGKEKGKKVKKEKKVKVQKAKKEKKPKKDKKKTNELIIPPIPICNLREKFGPENYEELLKLLTDFDNLEDMLEDQHMLAIKLMEEENLYDNKNFSHYPTTLVFRDFDCGKIYKKKLKILNTSMQFQKLRILEMMFTDPYDAVFFKIEPLFGIKKLPRGCFLQLTVMFLPEDKSKQIDGKIVFVSYDRYSTRYQKFFIRIQCVPSYTDLQVHPRLVKFGNIPIWKACNVNYKTIKLKNDGNKPCMVMINKAPDPLIRDIIADVAKPTKNKNKDWEYVSSIVCQCLENALSHFGFEHYIVKIRGLEEVKLNVTFRNVDHVGNYLEKYYLVIYEVCQDNTIDSTGCQKLIASAETTSYFIEISSDVLDFGVCILSSIYQLSCDILNNSPLTQSISIKFPSHMTDYIKSDVSHLYIPPQSKRTIWFKFLPRKSMLDVPTYFDMETSILEFPIYFCIISKAYPDMPPIKATVFAVLTSQKCLTVVPVKKKYYESSTATLNLGECSIFETVYADVELTNHSLAPQVYGFINIPQCFTIMPNYGFGEILPNEKKNLRIYFSPDYMDAMDSFKMEGNQSEILAHFRIYLETLSFLGQCKMELNIKRFKKNVDLMLKEMTTKREENVTGDMEIFAYYLKINLFQQENVSEEGSFSSNDTLSEHANEKDGEKKPCSTEFWLKARIVTPLYEFSHQYVQFPRTACGSYSIMQIELRAVNTDYFFKKSKPRFNYTATFRIQGGGQEITIEPSCGFLKKGEVQKITLIAKPSIPDKIVTNIAKNFKYLEVYELKKKEYEQMKEEALKKKSKKNKEKKTATKKKDKPSKRRRNTRKDDAEPAREETEEPEIVVSEKELALDYLDLYPAEMHHWRNLQPYSIDAEFTCTITYESENMGRKSETLHLNATCKVVKPDFATNLKMQRIDFGTVAIGLEKSEPIIIQNIHHDFITPRFSLLSPLGPFSLPYMKAYKVTPEHFLEVPIIFEPNQEETVEEYIEISSGVTTLPLILEGNGVTPDIEVLPPFLVFRLSTKRNAVAQCPIEIRNNNDVDLTITVEKLFELEGVIKEPVKGRENKQETVKQEANKKAKAKTEKRPKGKKGKPQKFSNELTEAEQASLMNFKKKDGKKAEFCYEAVNMEGDDFVLPPDSGQIITICFGTPELLAARKEDNMRILRGEKKTKGKKKKADKDKKIDKKSVVSKTSGKSKEGITPSPPEEQIYHVAKYNVMLNKTFLKDFILISTFIK